MNENFKTSKDFAIKVIAEGSFNDAPDDIAPHTYHIETKTFRLNRVAMSEWDRGMITAEEPKGRKSLRKSSSGTPTVTRKTNSARTSRTRFATRSATTTGTASRSHRFSAKYLQPLL